MIGQKSVTGIKSPLAFERAHRFNLNSSLFKNNILPVGSSDANI
jgi:hypothetical protein